MIINRWVIAVYLLLLFGRSSAGKGTKTQNPIGGYNADVYEFMADDLLNQQFPSHKFRDLKRRSRVITESNNRMIRVLEDLLSISDDILENLPDNLKEIFSPENYRPISLVPNSLLKFLTINVEKMLEGLPSYKPTNYFLSNETIENYRKAHTELLKDYRVIIIRAACRLFITSIMLSSLENLNNKQHSINLGISYPFLDDIIVRPKSTVKSNIRNILDRILNSIRDLRKKIQIRIKKQVNIDDDLEFVDLKTQELNKREFASSIYNHRQNYAVSIFGKDKAYFEGNPEVVQVLNNFIGKQERYSSIILQIVEKTLREQLNDEPSQTLKWNSGNNKKLISLCRNDHVIEILPNRIKFRTCRQLLNKIGEILAGIHYKNNKSGRESGRNNMLKRIRRSSSLKFIQVSDKLRKFCK